MSRQGSHAAYRKAVQVIEAAVNAWAPSEREIAGLAIPVIQENLAEQHTKVAKLLREPDTRSRPDWLLRNAEDRLVGSTKICIVPKRHWVLLSIRGARAKQDRNDARLTTH